MLWIEAGERKRTNGVAVPLNGDLLLLRRFGFKEEAFLLDEGSPFVPIGAIIPIDILLRFQALQHLHCVLSVQ